MCALVAHEGSAPLVMTRHKCSIIVASFSNGILRTHLTVSSVHWVITGRTFPATLQKRQTTRKYRSKAVFERSSSIDSKVRTQLFLVTF